MHRSVFVALLYAALAGAALAASAPACSSSSTPSSSNDAGSVGPNQGAGKPCDPALASPCLPAPPCYAIKCDEYAMICDETFVGCGGDDGGFQFETGASDAAKSNNCTSNHDCEYFLPDGAMPVVVVCAYPALGGCAAKGVCVIPEPPYLPDGAVPTACGCGGQEVPYVTGMDTAEPVSSNGPCGSTEVDAGHDAAIDAETDAAPDAPAEMDAGPDTAVDAAPDASLDAPSDG
jgi:hypothetical protein